MNKSRIDYTSYRFRIKVSLIAILVFMIVLFRLAPEMKRNTQDDGDLSNLNQITIDLIDITTQALPPSAPPRPRVPLNIVFDPVMSEVDLDVLFEVPIQLDSGIPQSAGQRVGFVVRNPQSPPRVQRIVEPVNPDNSTKIEVIAELTVGVDGRVEEVRIVSVKRRNPQTGRLEDFNEDEESYVQSTREAAFQWLFRPATEKGVPVRSVSEHVFSFGRGIN